MFPPVPPVDIVLPSHAFGNSLGGGNSLDGTGTAQLLPSASPEESLPDLQDAFEPRMPAPEDEGTEFRETRDFPELQGPEPSLVPPSDAELVRDGDLEGSPGRAQAFDHPGAHGVTNADPLQLYFTQMARTPLLSREEEVLLAKDISRARTRFQAAVFASPIVLPVVAGLLRRVLDGSSSIERTVKERPETKSQKDAVRLRLSAALRRIEKFISQVHQWGQELRRCLRDGRPASSLKECLRIEQQRCTVDLESLELQP